MQGLKALVIGMGVLIVIGMGVLAYGLVAKFGKDAQAEKQRVAEVPVAAASQQVNAMPAQTGMGYHHNYKHTPAEPFGDVNAFLPAGSEILEFIPNRRRLMIVFKSANGARAIKVIDVANGNDMGTIHLDAAIAGGAN